MARIALNGRFSGTPKPTGTQQASFHLFDAIIRENDAHDLVVFADPAFPGVGAWRHLPGVQLHRVDFQSMSRVRAQLWEQTLLNRRARQTGCSLVHHPMTTSPVLNGGLSQLITLHDLNFFLHPEWFSWKFRTSYRLGAVPSMRRADKVVCISQRTLDLACQHLGLNRAKIEVVYNGVKIMAPGSPPRRDTDGPVVLCVGSLQPHKNLPRLLEACMALREQALPGLTLRVVGRPQANFQIAPRLAELLHQPWVHTLGYLEEDQLAAEYANADVFAYPSIEEGFGLPILEAYSQRCLVVTSNTSCLPEIAGPAALFIDPLSTASLAQGLHTAISLPPGERDRRQHAGLQRVGHFTWKNAARRYLQIYAELTS